MKIYAREGRGRAAARPYGWRKVRGQGCRGRRPRRPAEGSRPLPTMQKIKGRQWQGCGPGMPGPYGLLFPATGVRGAWRRATSAASQQSWPARAVACPAGASIAHYPSFAPLNCGPSLATPQHPNLKWRKARVRCVATARLFFVTFFWSQKKVRPPGGLPLSCGFTQILHNIYFAVVVCFVRIHYNRKRYSENKTENGCVTPDDHF